MLSKTFITCVLILLSSVCCFSNGEKSGNIKKKEALKISLTDRVLSPLGSNVPAQFVGSVNAPNPMCNIITYVPCNYIIPPNDYVTFSTSINLTNCPVVALTNPNPLNTVTLTFEAAPPGPIFVWLTNGATPAVTTTPVYMTNAAITISRTTSTMTSWFTPGTTWTGLCVQAIYSDPPPSTLYYPMGCMIVYQ